MEPGLEIDSELEREPGLGPEPEPGSGPEPELEQLEPELELASSSGGAKMASDSSVPPVSVYVRVRPLTPAELAKGFQPLEGLTLESSAPEDEGAAVVLAPAVGGFTGLLGQEANTAAVFERCLAQRIDTILGGGAVSLFCYGYTGGGKTHTVLGSPGERGMYYLAAERLLRDLDAKQLAGESEQQRMFLHATACEIYNDVVYDLLGEEKVECTLRTDETGTLRVLGPAVCEHDSEQDPSQVDSLLAQMTEEQRVELHTARDRMDAMGIPSVWDGSLHSTDVTRSNGLRSISVHRPEDLDEIGRSSVASRAVGTSTEHAQSSRSHAIMRLEVVNEAVLTARAALNVAKSLLPARKNALDNLTNIACKLLFEAGQKPMLRVSDHDARLEEYVAAEIVRIPSLRVLGFAYLKNTSRCLVFARGRRATLRT